MVVLSSCWRIARRQALKRPSERTLGLSSEGGNTGRRADWPCHTKITNDLLRPSVQLPAGVCGCAPYTDFGRLCKDRVKFRRRDPVRRRNQFAFHVPMLLYLFV